MARMHNSRKLLGSNVFYMTILRNPVEQFESSYIYYRMGYYYKMSFNTFVQKQVGKWSSRAIYNLCLPFRMAENPEVAYIKRFNDFRGVNQQIYDLGFPKHSMNDTDAIKRHIGMLDTQFDLVLITERFDESLAVLGIKLGLEPKDLAYLTKLQRHQMYKVIDMFVRAFQWSWYSFQGRNFMSTGYKKEIC